MKKILRPLAITATVAIAAFALSGTAQATNASGPSGGCPAPASHNFGTVPLYSSHSPHSATQALAAPIPAGTYDLTARSWDGTNTDKRLTQVEPYEYFFIQLLDAASNVLATSGLTADLADGVKEAEWHGSVGRVSWTGADATQVKVVHGNIGQEDTQRVHAVCMGWAPVQVETTTTTTSSIPVQTEEPTTTTTTTTTVPLEDISDTQPAQPVQGQPQFTG